MRRINAPLNLGQTGDEVANLQEILMGFISKNVLVPDVPSLVNELAEERIKQLFGTATMTLVKNYQEQRGITPSGAGVPVLNQDTVDDMNELLFDTVTVTISGAVSHITGKSLVSTYEVQVKDLDYRNSTLLGQTQVAENGSYLISFDLTAAEYAANTGYSVTVTLESETTVLASQKVFYKGTEHRVDLTVADDSVTADAEYDAVTAALLEAIHGDEVADINTNDEDELQFLVNKTGEDRQTIVMLVQAKQLAEKMNDETLAPQLYALLRQNITSNLTVLLHQPKEAVIRALEVAIAGNLIPAMTGPEKVAFATALPSQIVATIASNIGQQPLQEAAPFLIANNVLGSTDKAKAFLELSATYDHHSEQSIWEYLEAESTLLESEDITALKTATTLSALTVNNPALTNAMIENYDQQGDTLANWAAAVSKAELTTAISSLAASPTFRYPDFITGDNKVEDYADYLQETIRKTYPTQALKVSLENEAGNWDGLPLMREHFAGFLTLNNSFDLKSVPAHTIAIEDLPAMDEEEQTTFIAELGIVQRLLNVTGNYTLINAMSADGLHSSMQIANLSEDDFMTRYPGISAAELKTAYDTAASNSAYTYVMAIDQFMDTGNSWGTLSPSFNDDYPMHVQQAYAEWRSLFGSLDSCNCNHCQSVYSPAAYLTDLLQFLKKNTLSLYNNLVERRPDLVNIELSCKNINTPVPHLDIVNELLEDMVSYGKSNNLNDHMYARQTTLDAKLQRAIPEYVNTTSYTPKIWNAATKQYEEQSGRIISSPYPALIEQVYPASLPYNYFKRQMDTHLDLQGVKGYDLMQRFSPDNSLDAWKTTGQGSNLCAEYLGLTKEERDIIIGKDASPTTHFSYYGLKVDDGIYLRKIPDPAKKGVEYPLSGGFITFASTGLVDLTTTQLSNLNRWGDFLAARVDVFLQQVQITYAELLQLLDCYAINPFVDTQLSARKLSILPNYYATTQDTCDLSQLCINGVDQVVFGRLYRFIRLKRALGWTYYELDKAMLGLAGKAYSNVDAGNIALDDAMFVNLAGIHKLSQTLQLPVGEVALFWKNIDIAPYRDYERSEPADILSEYDRIFRNSLTKDIDTVVYPFKAKGQGNPVPTDIINYLSGVMHINTGEMRILYEDLFTSVSFNNSLDHLSRLRREVVLMRSLKLRAAEWLEYRYWMTAANTFGTGPDSFSQHVTLFGAPAEMIRFASLLQTVKDAGVKTSEVANLLRDASADTIAEDKQNTKLATMLRKLQQELLKINLPAYEAVELTEHEDSKTLEAMLLRVLKADEAAYLINIAVTFPDDDDEQGRIAAINNSAFFLDNDTTGITDVIDLFLGGIDEGTRTIDKLNLVYTQLKIYIDNVIVKPYIISFLAKEFKIEQDITKVLLEACIEIGATPVSGMEVFLQTDYLEDTAIKRWPEGDSKLVFAAVILLQKAAWLVNKFRLSLADVQALWKDRVLPGVFELSELPVAQASATTLDPLVVLPVKLNQLLSFLRWVEVSKFVSTHTESLYEAIKAHDNADRNKTIDRIATVFRMSKTDLDVLLNHNTGALGLDINNAHQLPQTYLRIIDCLEMQYLLPAPMDKLSKIADDLGAPDTQDKANTLIQTVKAQYEDAQWLEVIQPVNDRLRAERRDALIAYLLANPPAPYFKKWFTGNDIFETLMLDVDMMSCMATTRVLLAVNTIQLWVDRVLLGLERDGNGAQLMLSNREARQWHTWRKLYRVWEANRKVFLYPENWIEPELRDDKSPFFLELEKFLKQNDLNDANVEEAYRTYLERLDDVANLEIVGMYRETKQTDYKTFTYAADVTDRDTIHVFGRTPDSPHIYYYRKRVADEWKPWVKMDVQIDGDHFIPVMWKGRLRFYWLVFTKDQAEDTATAMRSGDEYVTPTAVRWKIQLAWTEYKNNKWTAKQISKDALYSRDVIIEEAESKNHVRYYATTKLQEERHWNFKGDLEKIRDEYINFFCDYDAEGNLCFKLTEKVHRVSNGWMNHVVALNPGLKMHEINEIVRSNDEHMGTDLTLTGYFAVQFNGVKSVSEYQLSPSLYSDWLNNYSSLALHNNSYKLSKTNYWYYKDASAGYSHFPDNNIQLLGHAPGHTAIRDSASNTKWNNKYNNIWPLTIKDKERSKYLVYPRVVPEGFIDGANIAMPYFFYKDYDNCFFVENMHVYDELNMLTAVEEDKDAATGGRFGGTELEIDAANSPLGKVSRYRFHNFTHSNVGDFQEKLFNEGLDGLFNLNYLANVIQDKIEFNGKYQPTNAVLKGHGDRFYPKGHVDLSADGAYASYNWELFFHIPMLIANKLCQDQKFSEARRWYHYVFNPTVGGATKPADFWNFAEFYTNAANVPTPRQLMDDPKLGAAVARWADDPFKPHLVARTRISAYMKNTVMKYLDNLIGWADMLFRTDTRENINEATLLYVLAAQMLGRRPQQIPARATPAVHTYQSLTANANVNAFSNGLVRIENIMLASGASRVRIAKGIQSANNLLSGSMYYFCLPANDKLNTYWNTLSDRLFKIRHCQNIDGIERELALFDPPIDPALLVKAAAAGISLGEALSNINAPLPHYRFNVMSQKATELTQEVRSLGGQLLLALEKKDAEQLALLRSSQELTMMDLVTEVKEQQIADTVTQINGLQQQQKSTTQRRDYYKRLVDGGLNGNEQLQLASVMASIPLTIAQGTSQALASVFYAFPDLTVGPFSLGSKTGGTSLGNLTSAAASIVGTNANVNSIIGQMAGIKGSYARRKEDWEQQQKTAEIELKQIDHQILGAQIRKAVAEMELRNHKVQLENSRQMDEAMRNKYTNEELYEWMISEISITYFQAYKLAMDVAKRAERCYRHELGIETSSFIQPTYWDSLKKGLLAGDQLMYDIKRMEVSFLELNKRHLELTKHISLATAFPDALNSLKTDKACAISIPEWLFDMDYPGQHMRRIKSVSISIPCVSGPYTAISCKLSLMSSKYRKAGTANEDAYDETKNEADFIQRFGSIQSIATSHAQSDSGLFELSFRDERYLPFEGAGAVSNWKIELPAVYAQFDYDSISDVILHINYTALDEGGLKTGATDHVKMVLATAAENEGFSRMFHLNREFATEWNAYKNAFEDDEDAKLKILLNQEHFPFYCNDRAIGLYGVSVAMKAPLPGNITALPANLVLKMDMDGGEVASVKLQRSSAAASPDIYTYTFEAEEEAEEFAFIRRNRKIVKFALFDSSDNPLDLTAYAEELSLVLHCTCGALVGNADEDDEDWDPDTLATPASITVIPGDSKLDVAWSAVTNATSYQVQVSTVQDFVSNVTNVTATQSPQSITDLTNNVEYYVRVIAKATGYTDSAPRGTGNQSFTPTEHTPLALAQPASLTVTPGDGVLNVSWSLVTHATSYQVQVSTVSDFASNVTSVTATQSPQSITGLTNNVVYYVRVTAKANGYLDSTPGSSGSQTYTPVESVPVALAQPASLSVTPGDGVLNVSWSSVTHATSYQVQVSTVSDFASNVTSVTATQSPQPVTGLTNGNGYYVRVIAKANGYLDSTPKTGAQAYQPVASSGGGGLSQTLVDQMLAWWKADEIDSEDLVGGELDVWKDRSGQGNNLVAYQGKRPSVVSWRNAKPAVTFAGAEGMYRSLLSLPANTEDVTVFLAGKKTSRDYACLFELSNNFNIYPGGFIYLIEENASDVAGIHVNYEYSLYSMPGADAANVDGIYKMQFHMSDPAPETSIEFNDVLYQNLVGGYNSDHIEHHFESDVFNVGSRAGSGLFANFMLAEMIVVPSKVSTQDSATIKAYLKTKYGF